MTARERHDIYMQLISSRAYRKLRARYMAGHPLCELCKAQGYVRAADVVHHKERVEGATDEEGMRRRTMAWNNLQSLCNECHDAIHQRGKGETKAMRQARIGREVEAGLAKLHGTPGGGFLNGGGGPTTCAPEHQKNARGEK